MASQTHQSPTFITNTVASDDGTSIGYRQIGQGPGLIVVHGSMSSGYNHTELAEMLADAFTVYLMDRRGRGLSGPYSTGNSVETEAADVRALAKATGAINVFAVSAGAIVSLKAAASMPEIKRLAIYEPPLFANAADAQRLTSDIDEQLAAGNVAGALSSAMQGAQLSSPFMNKLPHKIMTILSRQMMNWVPKGEYSSFKDLAPTLSYEGREIAEASARPAILTSQSAKLLMLGGSKSSDFLKAALSRLAKDFPVAKRLELPGGDHSTSWNKAVRGNPALLAPVLREFFSQS